jgi:glucosamine--fructose-6-phosphate aminotransferase (isomerizing)
MSQMLEEIREQPAALEKTLASGLKTVNRLARVLERRRPRLILLAARGTSDNAAQCGRYLLEITTGIPVSLAAPSIFTLYDASIRLNDALVVAVSQSGESTDTNLVLERARRKGALTVGITNEPKSALAGIAEHLLFVRGGKEHSIAATKTYTGQLLSLYLLAWALGARLKTDELRRVPEWTNAALSLEHEIRARTERYRFMTQALVVARGLNYANAFEFSLKLMETCQVMAERFSSADLLHGPIAMVGQSFPAFLFTPPGVTWPGLSGLLQRLRAGKTETLILTDTSHKEAIRDNQQAIVIPARLGARSRRPEELYTPIPYIVPAQLFAACLAEWKGLDPDRPRALTKVTRTL